MNIYYNTDTKEVFATRVDGIDLPAFGVKNEDYKIVEIEDYTPGIYVVDDSTSPITLVEVIEDNEAGEE
jgi:hypothetical protein